MEDTLGLLRIIVRRGINLAVRDTVSSDPYVVITMGQQKLKTHVVKKNCNPEWNDELILSIKDPNVPINLAVYDKDMFTLDDQMGDAEIDIKPYIAALKLGKSLRNLPNGCALKRIQPGRTNCLADESSIVWNNGKITQDMHLKLRNVECGEVLIQMEWIEAPGCKGLECEGMAQLYSLYFVILRIGLTCSVLEMCINRNRTVILFQLLFNDEL
ncbi:protein C2-DOMAIN ABA-RELATED 7-like [Durio zibethinus]|uniref:Protein C2-DOMAIN ABA-RELATED 7-like n=1 Tax=Durio zibethinus TaxID=66656 RepID=A0A6P5X9C2_DURZI|nr:protein C2-DOMAIN ABA-RELATED 7-like [Durio zibethinus]